MADWPFVGRRSEQERITALLRSRPPVGVVLCGPQGVGKTRLAQATRSEAEGAGVDVRHVVAGAATSAIPFGALATLLPVLRELPDTPHATFQAAADHLLGQAEGGHLLISVDDAHHLDDASAALLHQLIPSPSVSVLLTVRADIPAPDGVTAVWRSGLAERIDLAPLDDDTVEAVLAAALDGPVAPGTVQALTELSAGNPLYLRELVTGSLASGSLARADGLWHLRAPATTPRLVDIVEERLAGLDDAERRALELVAIAGGLGYDLLVDLAAEDVIETLERDGLLTVGHHRRRRHVALVHAVHGDVVRARLTTGETARLHGEIADAIEATGARRRDDVLRVAVARLAGGGEVSAPLMAEAARRALVAYDLDLSERLARIAIDAGAGIPARLDLGVMLTRAGRQAEADMTFAAIDTTEGTDEERSLVAISWSDCLFWGLGDVDRAGATVEAAQETVTEPDWRDQLAVTRASYELLTGHPDVAHHDLEHIIAGGSARGVAASGLIAGVALCLLGRADEALDLVRRAWAARAEIDEGFGLVYEGMLVVTECLALGELGRLAEAVALGEGGHATAVAARVTYGQAWLALNTGRALRFSGPLSETARWGRESATCFEALGIPPLRRWSLYGAAWALAMAGARDEARIVGEQARAIDTGPVLLMEPETRRAEAALALLDGDRGAAVRLLHDGIELAAKLDLRTQELGAHHDLVRLGEHGVDVERVQALAADQDGAMAAAIALHATAADEGTAAALGEDAERFAAFGAALLAAEAAAQASAAARRDGDRRLAQRWAARSAELLEGLGPVDTPALALGGDSAELTAREREIAQLAARRIPSKEIAQRLSVSRRTVDNHLHRVYAKLGITGRDELRGALGMGPD